MNDDINKIIKATAKEIRHEFDLVIEDLEKGTLTAINEQLDSHTKQLGRLEERTARMEKDLTQVKDDVATIKVTLE